MLLVVSKMRNTASRASTLLNSTTQMRALGEFGIMGRIVEANIVEPAEHKACVAVQFNLALGTGMKPSGGHCLFDGNKICRLIEFRPGVPSQYNPPKFL